MAPAGASPAPAPGEALPLLSAPGPDQLPFPKQLTQRLGPEINILAHYRVRPACPKAPVLHLKSHEPCCMGPAAGVLHRWLCTEGGAGRAKPPKSQPEGGCSLLSLHQPLQHRLCLSVAHTGPSIHYWGLWSTAAERASCLEEKGLSRLCFSSLKHIKRRRSRQAAGFVQDLQLPGRAPHLHPTITATNAAEQLRTRCLSQKRA